MGNTTTDVRTTTSTTADVQSDTTTKTYICSLTTSAAVYEQNRQHFIVKLNNAMNPCFNCGSKCPARDTQCNLCNQIEL